MAEPATKRVPRAVREQQMLDAAVWVFSRLGYHAAAVDEIAEVAGISKPMVYAYIGTKEELFTACLIREGTRLLEAVAAVAEVDLPPDQQLRLALRAFFGFVAGHRDGWSVLYRQARSQEPFASEIARMRAQWIEIVAGLVRRAAPDADGVTPAAYAIVGAAESLADWIVEHGRGDPDVIAARLCTLIWSGMDSRLGRPT
jgi:AcrR family transcriptional regulator